MKTFEYFLFENFDAEIEAANPDNPRNFLSSATDGLISAAAEYMPYEEACTLFGVHVVHRLMHGGVLRCDGGRMTLDCPVFLEEDAPVLREASEAQSKWLAKMLEACAPTIELRCRDIRNGFPVETNLYHILCGMVFDGIFFDYLSSRGAVATHRVHASGLDYLNVIYEKCDTLQGFSDGLLCSYNRFADERCSLQSFGDANGDRLDFYRLFRLMEQGEVPERFAEAAALAGIGRQTILEETLLLAKTGHCADTALRLLEALRYAKNGKLCVPVFGQEHRAVIDEIEAVVEACVGDAFVQTLTRLASKTNITAVRHGVDKLEIANELYHILFGSVNEELVRRGVVAQPQVWRGEGRYLKCVEIFE